MSQALLEMQQSGQQPAQQREQEQSLAAEVEACAPGGRELVPISAPAFSPSCSQVHQDLAQQESCESVSQAFLEMRGSVQQPEEQKYVEQSMAVVIMS